MLRRLQSAREGGTWQALRTPWPCHETRLKSPHLWRSVAWHAYDLRAKRACTCTCTMLPRSWNDAEERAGQLELPQGCAGAILGFDGWGDGPRGCDVVRSAVRCRPGHHLARAGVEGVLKHVGEAYVHSDLFDLKHLPMEGKRGMMSLPSRRFASTTIWSSSPGSNTITCASRRQTIVKHTSGNRQDVFTARPLFVQIGGGNKERRRARRKRGDIIIIETTNWPWVAS